MKSFFLRPSRRLTAGWLLCAINLWLVVQPFCHAADAKQKKPANQASAASKSTLPSEHRCAAGPWGTLTYHYAYLEAPDSLMEFFPLPNTTTSWALSEEALAEFPAALAQANLPEGWRKQLLDPKQIVRMNGMARLFPPQPVLDSMTQEMRSVIYPILARFPENEYYANPVFILGDDVAFWAKEAHLREDLAVKMAKMTWRRGKGLVFSDLQSILAAASSDKEAKAIFKAFTRTRTLVPSLHLDKGTDLPAVLDYWGVGNKRKDLAPFLESIREAAGDSGDITLDICHLLSPLARRLLYTYPDLSLASNGRFPDCHWTSLNFFNPAPRNYYLNTRLAADAVLSEYEKVQPPYRYGDLLFFLNGETAEHSCTFIADDIVFTKNGDNIVNPWMFIPLDDLKEVYLTGNDASIQAYRHKTVAGP